MPRVQVKLPPHIAQMLNSESSEWMVLEEEIKDRITVINLLASLVVNYPGFRETVYNPNAGVINEQIGVILNGRLLTFEEISQTVLRENDSITIIPLYYGG